MLRDFATRIEQEEMRDALREVARRAPLFQPTMPYGTPFNLQITNAGRFGWTAIEGNFAYLRRHPVTNQPWPEIPKIVQDVAGRAAREASVRFDSNVCLINYYKRGNGSLGLHRDDTKGEDFNSPIFTISLGDSAQFGIGGVEQHDPVMELDFNSGDVLVMASVGRLFYHRVRYISDNSDLLPNGGRISATLRRVHG